MGMVLDPKFQANDGHLLRRQSSFAPADFKGNTGRLTLTRCASRVSSRRFMNRNPHVAVVGATGAVGIEMIKTLEKRQFPVGKLTLLASARDVAS